MLEQPRVRKLVTKWRARDGQTAQVVATVVVDGVIHGLLVQPTWYEEYEADIEAHGKEAERLQDERDRRAEADAKARLGPLVRKLMADPRFTAGKVGRAKRLTLAEALFPDEDRTVLGEVVDLAESQHWLATGR
ncbi:hypothetical protein MKK68_02230 [Methylobacterium sp. E-016]|uniref:hypothetical protein n=1 Tax=Methylobacterium sp. E-016 TaxID=2836556 RepID=UPI001FBC0C34|nr:hypothetical protein [Methylobacterium sp. E-016]MCJ2074479.1 hypothetical protein [Methylobacterium sp. E-016]